MIKSGVNVYFITKRKMLYFVVHVNTSQNLLNRKKINQYFNKREPAYFQGLWAADKKQISLNEEKVNSSEENIRRNSSPSFFSKTFIFVMDFAAIILKR